MKKIVSLLIILFIFITYITTAYASTTIGINKKEARPGDSIKITGTSDKNKLITIKIVDQQTNIIYLNTLSTNKEGEYKETFIVPDNTLAGILTVIAGSGLDIAKVDINIVKETKPVVTPRPTPEPIISTPSPTEQILQTLAPTTATSQPVEPAPSTTSIPISGEIKLDQETGIIKIVIDTSTLPKNVVSIKTPDGKVKHLEDAINGKITLEVKQQDVNEDGQLEVVLINEENVPFGSVPIQVLEGNDKPSFFKILMWIVIILIAIAIIPVIILVKKLKSL